MLNLFSFHHHRSIIFAVLQASAIFPNNRVLVLTFNLNLRIGEARGGDHAPMLSIVQDEDNGKAKGKQH